MRDGRGRRKGLSFGGRREPEERGGTGGCLRPGWVRQGTCRGERRQGGTDEEDKKGRKSKQGKQAVLSQLSFTTASAGSSSGRPPAPVAGRARGRALAAREQHAKHSREGRGFGGVEGGREGSKEREVERAGRPPGFAPKGASARAAGPRPTTPAPPRAANPNRPHAITTLASLPPAPHLPLLLLTVLTGHRLALTSRLPLLTAIECAPV